MIDTEIYLDNSSSTRLDEKVLEVMKKYYFDNYAVASSDFGYSMGIKSKNAVENSKKIIADKINANKEDIIFTSGATESSNLAIKGTAYKYRTEKKNHIITSKIEDFSVLNVFKALEREGFEVTYIEVDSDGFINFDQLKENIKEETIMVSIQHVNQEIGTKQDIKKIGGLLNENDIIFHVDGAHSFTKIPIDVKNMGIDLLTISAHTIHGPLGVGALYKNESISLKKLIDGGYQENNLRAGVRNIPAIVGFGKAVELVTKKEINRIKEMRDYLLNKLEENIDDITLNGDRTKRSPHNLNVTFHYVEGESITLHLDMRGIAVSTGSACFSKSLEASHVIMGIGGDHERAHGSVRFSFGRFNSKKQVDNVVKNIKEVVKNLREISPLSEDS